MSPPAVAKTPFASNVSSTSNGVDTAFWCLVGKRAHHKTGVLIDGWQLVGMVRRVGECG